MALLSSSRFGRAVFVGLMVGIGLGMFGGMRIIRTGNTPGSVLLVYLSSLGLMLIVWALLQQGRPSFGSIDLRQASFAALLGDTIVLPATIWLVTLSWKQLNHEALHSFWLSGWWFWLSFLIGLSGGIGFHVMGGRADSRSPDQNVRLHDSPTSWAHNLGVFPALLATIVYTLLPLLVTSGAHRELAWWALGVVLVGWGGLSTLDWARMTFPAIFQSWRHNPHWLDSDYTAWIKWWARLFWWHWWPHYN